MGSARPSRVCGATSSAGRDSILEVADCLLHFPSGAIATLSASRASQRKVRTQLVATPTALYDVDLHSGSIRWRLGGAHSSLELGPGTRTYWQHDAEWPPGGLLSVFDNGADPAMRIRSLAARMPSTGSVV